MSKEFTTALLRVWRALHMPIIGAALGLLFAVLILVIGFWSALLILILTAGGAALGLWLQLKTPLRRLLTAMMDRESGEDTQGD